MVRDKIFVCSKLRIIWKRTQLSLQGKSRVDALEGGRIFTALIIPNCTLHCIQKQTIAQASRCEIRLSHSAL